MGDYNIPVILASLTSGSLVPDPPTPTAIDGGSSPRLLSSLLSAQGHIPRHQQRWGPPIFVKHFSQLSLYWLFNRDPYNRLS